MTDKAMMDIYKFSCITYKPLLQSWIDKSYTLHPLWRIRLWLVMWRYNNSDLPWGKRVKYLFENPNHWDLSIQSEGRSAFIEHYEKNYDCEELDWRMKVYFSHNWENQPYDIYWLDRSLQYHRRDEIARVRSGLRRKRK